MKKSLIICILGWILLLSGCHHYSNDALGNKLIKGILITGQSGEETIHRYYASPEKVRQVLQYIRFVNDGFPVQTDPSDAAAKTVSITTISEDNTQKVYRQQDDRYFQTSSGIWRQIKPEQGQALWALIQSLPSDPQ